MPDDLTPEELQYLNLMANVGTDVGANGKYLNLNLDADDAALHFAVHARTLLEHDVDKHAPIMVTVSPEMCEGCKQEHGLINFSVFTENREVYDAYLEAINAVTNKYYRDLN